MMEKALRFLARWKWGVLIAWIVLAATSVLLLPNLNTIIQQTDNQFLPDDAQVQQAQAILDRIQPENQSRSNAIVVVHREEGLRDADRQWLYQQLQGLYERNEELGITGILSAGASPELTSQFVSEDGTLEMALVNVSHDAVSVHTKDTVEIIRDAFEQTRPDGTEAYLTGSAPINVDYKESSENGLHKTEMMTIVLVLSILLIVFRSPVAPWIPLITVALSFVTTLGLVGFAADLGLPVSSFTQSFLIAILFGAGTDYCILIIQRYREELANGLQPNDAMIRTVRTVGKTVMYAGSTVLIAFFLIGFAEFGMYQSAAGVAIGVAVTLIAGITLTPALLLIFGKSLFWPVKVKSGQGHGNSKLWSKYANLSLKKPILVILAVVLLFSPLIMFFDGKRSFDDLAEIDPNLDSVAGFRLVEEKFGSGEVFPVTAALSSNDSLRAPESLAAIGAATEAVSQLPYVQEVRSATRPTGEPSPELTPEQQQQMMASPEYQQALNFYLSEDGKSGKIEIILAENPYSEEALSVIDDLLLTLKDGYAAGGGTATDIKLAGNTATYEELEGISQNDFISTATLVVIGILIVLIVMLRSIVAPVYILLSLALNYLITMGILEFVFVRMLDFPGLSWTVSFFVFLIIVALGVDYSIFLMARFKEEYRPGQVSEAIRKAMVSTGGVIYSAAVIMGGTFAAFMYSGVDTLVQIGAGIVIGLALYTTLFMGLAVPAIAKLLGEANWWWPFGQKQKQPKTNTAARTEPAAE